MKVIHHPDARSFLNATRPFLEANQAECGLLYGLALKSEKNGTPDPTQTLFIHIEDDAGKPLFAILRMGRPGVLIYGNPDGWQAAASSVLPGIRKHYPELSALHGRVDQIKAVVNAAGQDYQIDTEQGLYRLDQLIEPRPCSGNGRLASMKDHGLITDWYCKFVEEAMQESADAETIARVTQRMIENEDFRVWENQGNSVAMTAVSRPTGKGITVSYVYTPVEHRGNGYASNLTAMVSRSMLENRGLEFCTLFTDMANPTSNKIYQAIGYYKITDMIYILLKP